MNTRTKNDPRRIPITLRHEVEQISKLTDAFCAEYLDAEYGELVRKLIAKLARKRPSPLSRGDLRIWAAASIYTVGSVNFLFDRTQRPHLTGDDLSRLTGVPKSTIANKAKLIRDLLRIGQLEPEFCRRELLVSNPMAWMISVNGFIVDARTMPPEVQEEARRRGLIPDLDGRQAPATGGGAKKPQDDAAGKSLAEAVLDVVDIIRGEPASSNTGTDGWDRIVRIMARQEGLPEGEVKIIETAIAKAYDGWSDAQRRSIWYETESGMTDDDDDETLRDTSFNGIGYALQVELLDEVARTARQEADELKKAAAKSPRSTAHEPS